MPAHGVMRKGRRSTDRKPTAEGARGGPLGDAVGAVLQLAGRTLTGMASMLAPVARRLPTEDAQAEQPVAPARLLEPLRVLQPYVVRSARRLFGRLGIVVMLSLAVLLLPTPAGLSVEGHRAIVVLVFAAGLLALEPVSLPIAALMIPVAQIALGIGDAPVAFATFSRPVVFLILASLFLAEALRKHGLTRRLALGSIVRSGGEVGRLLWGMMLIAAGISMWVENTATAAVLIPVALTISRRVRDRERAKGLLVLLVLGIAYSASLGGMATIMGSASNAVASGFLAEIRPWTFLNWMAYGLPCLVLLMPLTWWLLRRLVPTGVETLDVQPAQEELDKLGAISRTERELLTVMAVAALFWISGSFLESALALPRTLLSAAVVAVVAVAYLAARQIISWEDVKGVSWGIFLVIGAGLSLGDALSRTGTTEWLAGFIAPLVTELPLVLSLLALVYLSALLTNVLNNTTIAAVLVPVLIELARADPEIQAVQFVLPVTLATTFGYSLPSASGRMALIASSGIVERRDMMRYGLIVTLISSLILAIFFYGLSLVLWR